MLRVHVLGELSIEFDEVAVPPPTSRRARSLLGWLAVHPGLHYRAELAPRFWPEILDSSARASLRTAVWELRRSVGDACLVTTRDRIGIADDVWVDVRVIEELLAAGDAAEGLRLCRGELLAGLEDEWVYEARDHHRERVSGLLARLAAGAEAAGDLPRAIELTRRQAALDPISEEPARELIRRLAAAGDAGAALGAYRRLRDRLHAQLGIAPSPATRGLVEALRVAPVAAPAYRVPLPSRLRHPRGAPFVGRTAEFEQLTDLWRHVIASERAHLVGIGGEPGIGKTRLAAEFARGVWDEGAIVLHGRADEGPVVPYQPLVEAVRHYASAAPLEGPYLGELARLVPEAVRGPLPLPVGAVDRALAFQAIGALFADVSAAAPVLLVLDDLHWADGPTVLLLRQLVQPARPARLLVVATYRTTDLSPSHPLVAALADLRRDRAGGRIELDGLAPMEVAELIGSDGEFARRLHTKTAGNPLFIEELVRHLVDGREREGVPSGIKELIALRLARLADPTVQMLRAGAVAGQEFELGLLEQATGLDPAVLEDALEESCAARILAEAPEPRRYVFAHAVVREAIYESLSAARRTRLHRRVGEALEQAHGRLEPHLDQLAHHFAQAGDADRAADYALRAGDQAVERLAYERALAVYGAALEALPDGDERRTTLATRRGLAHQALWHSVFDRPARTTSPGDPRA